jgi:hybrid cluster-associated redox disulfide protein
MTEWPETIGVFLSHKMLCVGCMMNSFRTVIDACREYGLDEQVFRRELRDAVEAG